MTEIRPDEIALLVAWNKAHREFFNHLTNCDQCDPDASHNVWMCSTAEKLDNDQAYLLFRARKIIDSIAERQAT